MNNFLFSKLQEEKAKVSTAQTPCSVGPMAKKVSEPTPSGVDGVKKVPLPEPAMPKKPETPVLSKTNIPLPPKPKAPGRTDHLLSIH